MEKLKRHKKEDVYIQGQEGKKVCMQQGGKIVI